MQIVCNLTNVVKKLQRQVDAITEDITDIRNRDEELRKNIGLDFSSFERELKEIKDEIKRTPVISKPTVEKQLPQRNQYGCLENGCERSFTTITGLQMHMATKHMKVVDLEKLEVEPRVKGESALSSDEVDTTKKSGKTAFFRNRSPNRNRPFYPRNFNTSPRIDVFQSLIKSQQNMEDLMTKLLKSLEKSVNNMDGQNLATTQS